MKRFSEFFFTAKFWVFKLKTLFRMTGGVKITSRHFFCPNFGKKTWSLSRLRFMARQSRFIIHRIALYGNAVLHKNTLTDEALFHSIPQYEISAIASIWSTSIWSRLYNKDFLIQAYLTILKRQHPLFTQKAQSFLHIFTHTKKDLLMNSFRWCPTCEVFSHPPSPRL